MRGYILQNRYVGYHRRLKVMHNTLTIEGSNRRKGNEKEKGVTDVQR